MEATVDDDKKFNAAVSKMVNCLMTKAALKINARFSGATIAHCRLLQTLFHPSTSFYTYLELSQQDPDCPRWWE
jgi:hypothetical protein